MKTPEHIGSLAFEDLRIGMEASLSKTITLEDTQAYAQLSGDKNPVHTDPDAAAQSHFKKPISHGLLTASLFSAIFGEQLPGPGSIYISQSLIFKRPVYVGDAITAMVTLERIDSDKRRLFFRTACKTRGRLAIDGEAEIYLPALG